MREKGGTEREGQPPTLILILLSAFAHPFLWFRFDAAASAPAYTGCSAAALLVWAYTVGGGRGGLKAYVPHRCSPSSTSFPFPFSDRPSRAEGGRRASRPSVRTGDAHFHLASLCFFLPEILLLLLPYPLHFVSFGRRLSSLRSDVPTSALTELVCACICACVRAREYACMLLIPPPHTQVHTYAQRYIVAHARRWEKVGGGRRFISSGDAQALSVFLFFPLHSSFYVCLPHVYKSRKRCRHKGQCLCDTHVQFTLLFASRPLPRTYPLSPSLSPLSLSGSRTGAHTHAR